MFKWKSSGSKKKDLDLTNITTGLQKVYQTRLYNLEKEYKFHQFYSPLLTDGDLSSKPMVLLLGQYSTGKTTFISHLLECEYPGTRIGPEPTTDRFVAVMHGDTPQNIPGNAAVVDPTKPFARLSDYGNTFLSRFEVATVPSQLLKGITIIDTPGVLAGNKQTSRGYDFEGVIQWFSERVDLILLMFDAHKLDISDEFKRCIQAIRGNDSKIRIILNKADSVNTQQLMRVYGALMWSLGKVIPTPEVTRVYIGSFWDQPLNNDTNRMLFEAEANDLYSDIQQLPSNSALRKLNDFIKRTRLLKAHLRILDYCRHNMPMFGKTSKQHKLLDDLTKVFNSVSQKYSIPLGDFPTVETFKNRVESLGLEFGKLSKLESKRMELLEEVITKQVPILMSLIPNEQKKILDNLNNQNTTLSYDVSPFLQLKESNKANPLYLKLLSTPPDIRMYENDFYSLGGNNTGLLSGLQVKDHLSLSKLPSSILHRIWNLSDITKDGFLNLYEFSLCKYFINLKLQGFEIPIELPKELYPINDQSEMIPTADDICKKMAIMNKGLKQPSAYTTGSKDFDKPNSNAMSMNMYNDLVSVTTTKLFANSNNALSPSHNNNRLMDAISETSDSLWNNNNNNPNLNTKMLNDEYRL